MKDWKIKLIFVIFIAGIGLLLFKGYKNKLEFYEFKDTAFEEFGNYEAELIDKEKQIYQGKVVIGENNKYIQNLLDSISHLKEVVSSTKIKTVTKIDTVEVPIKTEVKVGMDGDYIKTPFNFNKENKWYSVQGTVLKDKIEFSRLSYTNDLTLNVGVKDNGSFLKNLFKKNETVITAYDTNPYSKVKQLSQIAIKERKKKFHIGPQAGFFMINGKLVPSIGFGATYSLISF